MRKTIINLTAALAVVVSAQAETPNSDRSSVVPAPSLLEHAILGEEVAWLKMAGWDQYHGPAKYYQYLESPAPRKGLTTLPLPRLSERPVIDGDLRDSVWANTSRGSIELSVPVSFDKGPLLTILVSAYQTDTDLVLALEADRPLFRPGAVLAYVLIGNRGLELRATATGLEAKPSDGRFSARTSEAAPVAVTGAVAADACAAEIAIPLTSLPGNIAAGVTVQPDLHGLYELVRSVIPESSHDKGCFFLSAWKKIVFRPDGFAAREEPGQLRVRLQNHSDQSIELAFTNPKRETLTLAVGELREMTGDHAGPVGPEWMLRWQHGKNGYELDQLVYQPLPKMLAEFEKLIALREQQNRDVRASQTQLPALRAAAATGDRAALLAIRAAKRALFFDDPALTALADVLFVKRHPLWPSHNYTEYIDAQGWPGGGIGVWRAPVVDGRLKPDAARVEMLFDAGLGFVRTPAASHDAQKIYFAYLPADPVKGKDLRTKDGFFRIMAMNRDGGDVRQLTDGRFNDVYPTPLPDGGLALISSRSKARFLCFTPGILTLFRMEADGTGLRQLSPNDLTEWAPSVLRDGRLAWTRSEYQDKGAAYGHTAWAIRPDGTYPELIFGNNTVGGYVNIREMPGTDEFVATLVSHMGDMNGPLALIRPSLGRFNPNAVLNITPDVEAATGLIMPPVMETFREPYPISRDFILCAHSPLNRFGLAVVDRYGNRELLHLDEQFGSMCPTLLRPQPKQPMLASTLNPQLAAQEKGVLMVMDVYAGLEGQIAPGEAKYLQVFEEVKSQLRQMPNGEYPNKVSEYHEDWYASPVHRLGTTKNEQNNLAYIQEWPAYIAKTAHGLVPIQPDGSASFEVPAGKMLYFSLLDANFNEIQRMRSVFHLQPGESRSCIGCHENRSLAPPTQARYQVPKPLVPPPWGAVPFAYVDRVQPIFDRHCVSCHNGTGSAKLDLRGTRDEYATPMSYKMLLHRELVNYFPTNHPFHHEKAQPKKFGTLQSKLTQVLDAGHQKVQLSRDEMLAIKTWIAMNCPLYGDYRPLTERLVDVRTPNCENQIPAKQE